MQQKHFQKPGDGKKISARKKEIAMHIMNGLSRKRMGDRGRKDPGDDWYESEGKGPWRQAK